MTKKFFVASLFIGALTNQASAMDRDIFPLNNGLLTEIPGRICKLDIQESSNIWDPHYPRTYIKSIFSEKASFLKLLNHANPATSTLFYPFVYRVNYDGSLLHLGELKKNIKVKGQFKEMKEAIRQNKALYLAIGRGAIVYSTIKQPAPRDYDLLLPKEKLEQMGEIEDPFKNI